MDRLVSECDIIYHLAAAVGVELVVRDPVRVLETNVKGTEMILRVGARYRKKVILASTSEVYGKNTRVPFSEEDDRTLGPHHAQPLVVRLLQGDGRVHGAGLPQAAWRYLWLSALFQHRGSEAERTLWHGDTALCAPGVE